MDTNPVWLIAEGEAVRIQPTMSSPPGTVITTFEELLAFVCSLPVVKPPPPSKPITDLDDLDFGFDL